MMRWDDARLDRQGLWVASINERQNWTRYERQAASALEG
jgi:hypothetical protein